MEIKIKEEVPSIENYINIRLKAGLSRKSTEAAEIGLTNGIFSLVAYYGTPEFYQKFGFESVKDPGSSGMCLRIK